MTMTKEEIAAEYRQAKFPMKQIAILADQNCCDRKEILEVLREQGCELPKTYQKKPVDEAPAAKVEPAKEPTLNYLELRSTALDTILNAIEESEMASSDLSWYILGIKDLLKTAWEHIVYKEGKI